MSKLSKHIDVKYQLFVDHARQRNIKVKFVKKEHTATDTLGKIFV